MPKGFPLKLAKGSESSALGALLGARYANSSSMEVVTSMWIPQHSLPSFKSPPITVAKIRVWIDSSSIDLGIRTRFLNPNPNRLCNSDILSKLEYELECLNVQLADRMSEFVILKSSEAVVQNVNVVLFPLFMAITNDSRYKSPRKIA